MTRRCSHCSNNGHNSRTCPARGGVKLFGVRLTDGSIRKSASMGSLSSAAHFHSSSSAAASPNPSSPSSDPLRDPNSHQGYASDDPTHASSSSSSSNCRKKGVPWTEEEHRMFLVGLQKLGKGDWRGIARNFVVSRSPTQVASHAQKYFIRQNNGIRRKRRSSLFDMVPDMSMDPLPVLEGQFQLHSSPKDESESINQVTPLNLSIDQECEAMESASNTSPVEPEVQVPHSDFPPMVPAFFPTYMPIPFPFLPPNSPPNGGEGGEKHQVLKPTPVLPKDPIQVDELLGLSKLSIGEGAAGHMEPSALSIKLLGASSRQSAFHANPTVGGSDLSPRKSNAIHAL